MMRIDTIEPKLRNIINDLQGMRLNLTDTSYKDIDAVLRVNINSLKLIVQEIDTCLSEIEARIATKYEDKW